MSEDVGAALAVIGALVLVAVTIGGLAQAAQHGRLKRNALVGLRIPATLASDEAWDAGHRAAVPWLRCSAAAAALFAIVSGAALAAADLAALVVSLIGLAVSVLLLVPATVVARRAAQAA